MAEGGEERRGEEQISGLRARRDPLTELPPGGRPDSDAARTYFHKRKEAPAPAAVPPDAYLYAHCKPRTIVRPSAAVGAVLRRDTDVIIVASVIGR